MKDKNFISSEEADLLAIKGLFSKSGDPKERISTLQARAILQGLREHLGNPPPGHIKSMVELVPEL